MTEPYNQATAGHYAAYRPPLHGLILGRVLTAAERFEAGLDVGCGTGYSAIALVQYCRHVFGIEPSQAMLARATPHAGITYQPGRGDDLPLPDQAVEVVTFAGSLFYAKSERLIQELKRVCRKQALLIPYDFEVLVGPVLVQCGLKPEEIDSDYDYEVNFSDRADFKELLRQKARVDLEGTAAQLAHILLSSSDSYRAFVEKYAVADPFPRLVADLESRAEQPVLQADIYYAKYRLEVG